MPPLEQFEHRAGAGEHRRREPGEAADFDAVGAVGAAGLQLVEEEDLIADLANTDIIVANSY